MEVSYVEVESASSRRVGRGRVRRPSTRARRGRRRQLPRVV